MILSFISINVPGLVQLIQSLILSFIYMDLLQTDQWYPSLFFSGDIDSDYSLSPYFDLNGFTSMKFILNLGSTFFYLVIILFLYIVLLFAGSFHGGDDRCGKVVKYMRAKMYWSVMIRFIMQQSTPMMMASAINVYVYQIEYNQWGDFLGIGFTILTEIMIPAIVISFISIIKNARANDSLLPKEFKMKFGDLTEGLKSSSTLGIYWNVFTMMRWILTVGIIICLREHSNFQIVLLLVISLAFQMLLLLVKPFQDHYQLYLALFNELMVSAYLYILLLLLDEALDYRFELGFTLLGLVFLSMLVNIANTFYQIISQICTKYKQRKSNLIEKKVIQVQCKERIDSRTVITTHADNSIIEDAIWENDYRRDPFQRVQSQVRDGGQIFGKQIICDTTDEVVGRQQLERQDSFFGSEKWKGKGIVKVKPNVVFENREIRY
ncbi:hypothetical protein FGO68_gene11153 [Halteria grandinella]|uniref:TRP C-terminal domain-containing protein n=1 Tax=Halteria grandinella TaxID=5974 RepID=A0A8J8T996_HALGN|nr:hypothetical protein FGO68_gene11153 [Halteria grandinella]